MITNDQLDKLTEFCKVDNMKYPIEFKRKSIKTALENHGYYDNKGIWNSLYTLPGYPDTLFRKRVETLILRKVGNSYYIFLKFIPVNERVNGKDYSTPGGSTERNIPDITQAVNECHEETHFKVASIKYSGISYLEFKTPKEKFIRNDLINWNGSINKVYVAFYNGKYKQKIDKYDEDSFIRSGKFYSLRKIFHKLNIYHQKALIKTIPEIKEILSSKTLLIYNDTVKGSGGDKLINQITEAALSSKERKALDDSVFGIPELRKYPLNDKDHVKSAIRFFNKVDNEHEKELAENIINAMDEYGIPYSSVGENNRLYKYISQIRADDEITEATLSSKERNKLKDSTFGIPELRKYPLNDRAHVKAAIRFFNKVDKKHESELAENILRAMKKFNIPTTVVGKNNKLYKYTKKVK